MAETTYVRTEMLPPKPPPPTQTGVIGWLRENLFDGWKNTLLTLVALYVIYALLSAALPWFLHAVWNAESLNECREIIKASWGPEADGACFAVIRDRWHQMLYGFYPQDLYWRPNLAFVLMLVALSPVLFPNLPRKMLVFSLIYPFLGYWLLWGGTVWAPVSWALGFILGYFAFILVNDRGGTILAAIAAVVVPVLWWLFGAGPFADLVQSLIPISLADVESRQFGGFMLSVTIGITGIVGSLPLGIILALGRQSNLLMVKSLSVGFIEFIRGVPLITLLFVASTLLNIFMPPGTNFDIILRVVIMVTLFSAAYVAEVVRGGLAALPKGQYEAAAALGLDYWKSMRLVILPQALKIAIPGIVSTFIGLFKDTTLVSIIGLMDPIGLTNAIRANAEWQGIIWELYGFVALVFWIFCFSMSRYSMYLESRLETGHR